MISSPTVFLVADDERSRRQIVRVLVHAGIQVEVSLNEEELLQILRADIPGCIVIEFTSGPPASLELRERLQSLNFPQPVLMLAEGNQILRVDPPHAGHFIKKPLEPQLLVEAVRNSLEVDARNRALEAEGQELKSRLSTLTERERDVFKHMLAGHSVKRTSVLLGISQRTIENHRQQLRKKLKVVSLAQLLQKLLPDLLDF